MDSEEKKMVEIHGTAESSSIHLLMQWYGVFYLKHTQRSPKQSRTSSHDVKNHVSERRFSGSVPLDLAWEILSRLPAKSIVRSRAVSKLWSSIITNPDFINPFPAVSSESSPCLLLIFQKGETRFVFSFPQHQNPVDPYSQVERYEEVINPNDRHLSCSDSVHGLICFETCTKLVIWNPTMRRFFTLLEPENSLRYVGGFLGYDPIECKYKVLIFYTEAEIRVLTLGAKESWRIVKASPMHFCTIGYAARCIDGILYYKAYFGLTRKLAIMSFDLRFEKFNLIAFPMDDHSLALMVPYEGRFALVRSTAFGVEIWVLEDADNQKWSYQQHVYPPSDQQWMSLDLKGVTDAGDEFRRLRGLGFGPVNDLDVFPNHIESLFSL